MKNPSISAFFPAYNEEMNIEHSVRAADAALRGITDTYEIIIVDDGSRDQTLAIADRLSAENPRVRVVRHEKNQGYGAALKSGIAAATCDWIFFADADMQFRLEEISKLTEFIPESNAIIGYRAPRRDPFFRLVNAYGWNRFIRFFFGLKVRDIDCAFKLIRRKLLQSIPIRSTGSAVSAEILIRLKHAGANFREVPVTHLPRRYGVPTGAKIGVIVKAFLEIRPLYFELNKRKIIPACVIGFILLSFVALHIRLVSQTFFYDASGNIRTTTEGYGDVPLHLTMITKFAFAPTFDLGEPIFYGSQIHYHFATDLMRGLILRLTHAWRFSFLAPLYALIILNVAGVFYLYRRLLGNAWRALAAFLVFFLGAGPAETLNAFKGMFPDVIHFGATYPSQNIDFASLLFMSFIHQQAFFLGLFAVIVFSWLMLELFERPRTSLAIAAGVILGLMPFVHAHGFLSSGAALGVAAVLCLRKKDREVLKKLLLSGVVAAVLALPQVYFILTANKALVTASSFSHFRLGWMIASAGYDSVTFAPGAVASIFSLRYLEFLWVNFGVVLILFVVMCLGLYLFRKKYGTNGQRPVLWLGISGALLALSIEFIQYQPWDFDDNKILVYALFFMAPCMIYVLWTACSETGIFRIGATCRKSLAGIVTGAAVLTAILPGLIHAEGHISPPDSYLPVAFSVSAQDMADYIRQNVPYAALILTGTSNLNPVDALAGRPVLVGYTGWLWSTSGVDYTGRLNEIAGFYADPSRSSPLLHEYPIGYVLYDNSVKNDFHADKSKFDAAFTKVYETGEFALYKI
ncbi:MAG: glycosyltransferase family 2 protein [Patescibacteria group bacterium]|nr:glycosyltransferase family 2 protein [Patescibacteria group bacterium]